MSPSSRKARGVACVVLLATLSATVTSSHAGAAHERVTQQPRLEIETSWFPNGLRLVTVTGPWETDLVSIRVMVSGGLRTLPPEQRYAAHLLEHLVFSRGPGIEDLLIAVDRRGESLWATVDANRELREYDVDAEYAPRVFDCLLGEWTRSDFDPADFARERSRVLHEDETGSGECAFVVPYTTLGQDPLGPLAFSANTEIAYVDTVSSTTLRAVFRKRYSQDNVTLLIAANRGVLEKLRGEIEAFGRLPIDPKPPVAAAFDRHMPKGRLNTGAISAAGSVGLVFPVETAPAFTRLQVLDALVDRVVGADSCGSLSVSSEACVTSGREVWLLQPNSFDESFSDTLISTLARLGSPDSENWWRQRVSALAEQRRNIRDRQDYAADALMRYLQRSAHAEAAPTWNELTGTDSARELAKASRAIRASVESFQLQLDKKRMDLGESSDESADLAATILELDSGGPWWMVSVFAWLLVLIALGHLVIRRLRSYHIRRRGRATAVGGAIITVIAVGLVAPGAQGATPGAKTVLLDNSLRVVTWPCDDEARVAVRLVVQAPVLHPDSTTMRAFFLMANTLFDGPDISGPDHPSFIEFGPSYVTYAYNRPASQLEHVLARLHKQLECGVSERQYDHAVCNGGWHSITMSETMTALWRQMDGSAMPDFMPDPSFGAVQEAFRNDIVASRMCVVIVGSPRYLEGALRSARSFADLPAGRPVPTQATTFEASLSAQKCWRSPGQAPVVGLIVDANAIECETASFYSDALSERCREFAFQSGAVYDMLAETMDTQNERVLLITPIFDSERTSTGQVWTAFQKVTDDLARPEALDWWRSYLDGCRRSRVLFGEGTGLPSAIANDVVGRLSFSATRAEDVVGPKYLPTAEEALREYQRMLRSGRLFSLQPARTSLAASARERLTHLALFVSRDLFGPNARNRAIAAMCCCLFLLVVIKTADLHGGSLPPEART